MKRAAKRSRRARRSPLRRAARSHKAVYAGNHPEPLVSVIIPAMNEAGTIAAAVTEARKVDPRCEVIVVANGSSDGTAEIAASCGARVISCAEPLGHDVGRSVGAESAKGEILLFTDGDLVIPAKELRPFAAAVRGGADIALNNYSGPVRRHHPHPVVLSKHALNILLRRPDLKGSSMTAVPHALSRRALDTLGSGLLSSPPVAQAKAVMEGLRVVAANKVPVGRMNVIRPKTDGTDPLQQIIVADHLRAVSLVLEQCGGRAGFGDGARRREMVR
ncbi:Glycosyl transferase family 2 [Paenibacillus sophorae]|uniref:Glucosyl-3-phosphoglycerate synthase n=1 Tax=Paenibacillus sophorae TaxID=1333845 RepID=A0A1H8Q6L9_9BACL|nr:glycosyltransferase [Paenibacillus sophorae]QWU15252.1 glycosyltransferase [Paenibacillus sophorae]SEO49678.1 Glycosyl transferase family 2 [Paenibacillus sophorae]